MLRGSQVNIKTLHYATEKGDQVLRVGIVPKIHAHVLNAAFFQRNLMGIRMGSGCLADLILGS